MQMKSMLLGAFMALIAGPAFAQANNAINVFGVVDKFDATEWIGIVKDAGAKYVIFMTAQNGAMQRRPGGSRTGATHGCPAHPRARSRRSAAEWPR